MTKEAFLPLLLVDCLAIHGLTVWDRRAKAARRAMVAEKAGLANEVDKKATRATKAANRQQQKAVVKQAKNQGHAFPSTVPKRHILQPDKMK